jgi:hypothetical protein
MSDERLITTQGHFIESQKNQNADQEFIDQAIEAIDVHKKTIPVNYSRRDGD